MNKFDKTRNDVAEREFATYQFKIPYALWTRFKIKSLTEKRPTYRETLIDLIERYVGT
tara:strand:- start:4763 stop:4936 length:174 start_codon:yes stop_codon:yes gene_type:complete